MKIYVIVRTRDSAYFIERFCSSYSWADKILVADGGSLDNTIQLASQFSNVEVKSFNEKVYRGDTWRNPHGKHINFLIDWAESEEADWIIFDDVDCVPNYKLKEDFMYPFELANSSEKDFIQVNRVYIYKDSLYFEKLTSPIIDGVVHLFKPSLWAWRAGCGYGFKEKDPFKQNLNFKIKNAVELYPPFCLLHYFYPNDEYMKNKIDFYNAIYDFGDAKVRDPKIYGGQRLPLEEWMRE